jgi:hypothetical protein
MTYKAYIHKDGKFPITDWAMAAYYGFKERGTKVILFDDLNKVPLSKYNIIVSGVENTIKRLTDLGIEPPKPLHIPTELQRYSLLNRDIRFMTFKEFKDNIDTITFPIFIKPEGHAKQFVAGPVNSKENALNFFANVPDDMTIMVSKKIEFVSEYRAFIVKGKLVGLKHYLGDFTVFPNTFVIEAAINFYKSAPDAYTMDVGISDSGFTLVIECNDAWSIGNYGLANDIYAGMLAKRWHQLMCQK